MINWQKKGNIFHSISFWVLTISFILLPFFFLPTKPVLLSFGKSLLVYSAAVISLFFLLVHLLKGGEIFIFRRPLFIFSFLILVISFISSLFSHSFSLSYFGYGFELGSLSFIILFFTVLFLAGSVFKGRKKINKAHFIIFVPFLILSFYYLLKIFSGSGIFSLEALFNLDADTFLGRWNELSIYAGAVIVFSMFFLSLSKDSKYLKAIYWLCFIAALILLIIVNFTLAWILSLCVCLIFLALSFFKYSQRKFGGRFNFFETSRIKNKYLFIIFFAVALIFIFPTGDFLRQRIYDFFEISHIEVKPSWQGTYQIFSKTLSSSTANFIVGSGPNSFSYEWRLHKPQNVNLTDYWNTEFNYGAGLIPSFFITTGFLGFLGWLVFIFAYLFWGFRHVYRNFYDGLPSSLFFTSLYFWLISIFYLPSHSLFIFTAFFSGLFLAAAFVKNESSYTGISFSKSSIKTGALSAALLVIIVLNFYGGLVTYKKFTAGLNFEKGARAFQNGDLTGAEEKINRSLKSSESDTARRFLSEIYLIKLREYPRRTENPSRQEIADFQNYFEQSLKNLEAAIIFNRRNFENYIKLGKFYEFLSEIGVTDSHQNAINAYLKAQNLDPFNPLPEFLLANLEFSAGSLEEAQKNIESSLSKKPNYGDVLFLNSKIKFSQGNLVEAIQSALTTANLFPEEPYSYFHLGLLYYQSSDYQNAVSSLEKAVALEPQFANAKYFLALSLAKNGETGKAVRVLESLSAEHPGNQQINEALNDIQSEEDDLQEVTSDENQEQVEMVEMIEDQDSELPFND